MLGPLTTGAATGVPKGDNDRAIADYTEVIRLNPNYAMAFNNRGAAYGKKVTAAELLPTTTRPFDSNLSML